MTYRYQPVDPTAKTRPVRVVEPISQDFSQVQFQSLKPKKKHSKFLPFLLFLLLILVVYLVFPLRTNFLILGVDPRDDTFLGRSDTIILVTVNPLKPTIGMLSIPRDLWVTIDGQGENRINTAHFFGEIAVPGSGGDAAATAIRENFGVTVYEYVRVRFDGIRNIVDAMGGVDVTLDKATSGYDAGQYHFDGEQALAFVRSRSGSDDFFRMENGQLFIKSAIRQMINPASWSRIPQVVAAVLQSIDTNIPLWQIPRFAVAFLRCGFGGIDSRTINRDMATGYITDQGADVLLPNWDAINPVLMEMFGQ